MQSTMNEGALLTSGILRHGARIYGDKSVITCESDGYRSESFAEVAERSEQLAKALHRLGVVEGDRVGTLCWNNQEHLEAYLAVPSMGAVLHTLNVRLFPEQLSFVINHAGDKVIIVDAAMIPQLLQVSDALESVEIIIVRGQGDTAGLGSTIDYEELLAEENPGFAWPSLDERSAAAMCYTSGTTGNPKGVVYSHRSIWLHSQSLATANAFDLSERDRCLLVVPMFHANGWGIPYGAFFAGSELVLPQHLLQGEALIRTIGDTRPTIALGVPTIWNDLLRAAESSDVDFSSIQRIVAGGSAVPRSMIETFRSRFDIPLLQGWGMTEISPLGGVSIPPHDSPREEELTYRGKAGRVVAGVEIRVCNDAGEELPQDGVAVGEFEARGPWVTSSYYNSDDAEKFHDGWLRTGDVGTLDRLGFLTITDRTKDIIKSGGEWISSVQLENEVMAHPSVFEAAVIAIQDEKWQERPLVCVVTRPNETTPTPSELIEFLTPRVARWWLPTQWAFIDAIPKTSVGKFDKKLLRSQLIDGELKVETSENRS